MRYLETIMGIPMSADIRDEGDHSATVDRAFAQLRGADRRFSAYRQESELSQVNRRMIPTNQCSKEFRDVVAIGTRAASASGGAFRVVRTDGSFDLDGVVKGWAAARAARELRTAGVRDFCVNAGGDIVTSGHPGGGFWRIGLQSPIDRTAVFALARVTDAAIATSGAYERGQHIVDGRTGRPARGLISATVIADDLTDADVLATSVFALGRDGVRWALEQGARAVIAVDEDGSVLTAGDADVTGP